MDNLIKIYWRLGKRTACGRSSLLRYCKASAVDFKQAPISVSETHCTESSAPMIKEHAEIINVCFPEGGGGGRSHAVASGFNA